MMMENEMTTIELASQAAMISLDKELLRIGKNEDELRVVISSTMQLYFSSNWSTFFTLSQVSDIHKRVFEQRPMCNFVMNYVETFLLECAKKGVDYVELCNTLGTVFKYTRCGDVGFETENLPTLSVVPVEHRDSIKFDGNLALFLVDNPWLVALYLGLQEYPNTTTYISVMKAS
jgi:hypothetical protein